MNTMQSLIPIDYIPTNVSIYTACEDGDFILKDINQAVEKNEQVHKDDVIGKKITQLLPDAKAQDTLKIFQRVYKSGIEESFNINFHKDEDISGWRKSTVSRLDDNSIMTICENISAQKELEEKIEVELQKNQEKDQQLFESSKMAQIGEMLESIIHQWRQPLTSISMCASNIELKYMMHQESDLDIPQSMKDIVSHTQHLSKTIQIFRDFLHKTNSQENMTIHDVIKQTLLITSLPLKDSFITLIDEVNYDDITTTLTSKGELSQVMINIINNAKDALLENSVEKPWIKLSIEKNDHTFSINIEDNAGGIPSVILPKIFEPYFTTKGKEHGTGIGLNMSRKIITENLNGRLLVENTDNGAKFIIELPL